MKRFVTAILTLSLALSLCACFAAPGQETTQPTVMGVDSVIMEGYATETLEVRDVPDESGAVIGMHLRGSYVQIYEIEGGWGRTDLGWILWDQLSSQPVGDAEGGSDDSDTTQNGGFNQNTATQSPTQAETTTPTETTTGAANGSAQLPQSDNNQAIIGLWYDPDTMSKDEWDKTSVYVITFTEHGYYYPDWLAVRSSDLSHISPDAGLGSYSYATVGNMVYFLEDYDERWHDADNMPALSSNTFSVNGDTLVISGRTFYRTTQEQLRLLIVEKYYS